MRRVLKRTLGIMLCATLIFGNSGAVSFAAEIDDISDELITVTEEAEPEDFAVSDGNEDVETSEEFDDAADDALIGDEETDSEDAATEEESSDSEEVVTEEETSVSDEDAIVEEEAAPEDVVIEEEDAATDDLVISEDDAVSEDEVIEEETSFTDEDVTEEENGATEEEPIEEEDAACEEELAGETGELTYKPYESANYELTYTVKDKKVTITGYKVLFGETPSGELVIPKAIGKYPVTEIADNAFYECYYLGETLTIPDNVISIGESAFHLCSFDELIIGKSVQTIGDYAFAYLPITETVTIPASVSEAGAHVFNNCNYMKKFVNLSNNSDMLLPYVYRMDESTYWIISSTGEHANYIEAKQTIIMNYYQTLQLDEDSVSEPVTYTGYAVGLNPEFYYDEIFLDEWDDYTITYKNNVKAYTLKEGDPGFNSKKAPSYTIKLKGNYSGKKTYYFCIEPKTFESADISVDQIDNIVLSGKGVKPSPVLYDKDKKLTLGKDFKVSYFNEDDKKEYDSITSAGNYHANIEGIGNYKDMEYSNTFHVFSSDYTHISKASVKISDLPYTGESVSVIPVVKSGKVTLALHSDYEVTAPADDDWTTVGTHTAVISGLNQYVGTKKVTFKITGNPMNKVSLSGKLNAVTYTGRSIDADISSLSLKYKGSPLSLIDRESFEDLSDDSKKTYDVYYYCENNENAGTAKLYFVGVNKFSGTIKKTFKINPLDISKDPEKIHIAVSSWTVPFFKHLTSLSGLTIEYDDMLLIEGTDYTVSYSNNTKYSTNPSKQPTVKITGKGNFKGTISSVFTIKEMPLKTAKTSKALQISAPDVAFSTKAGGFKSPIVLTFDGKKLKAGSDYEKKIRYFYSESGEEIDAKAKGIPAGTEIGYEITAKAGSGFTGSITGTYMISHYSINKIKISVRNKDFEDGGVFLGYNDIQFSGYHYGDITYEILPDTYKNNEKPGKATVVIKGTGDFCGTKTITFNINQRKILVWDILFHQDPGGSVG